MAPSRKPKNEDSNVHKRNRKPLPKDRLSTIGDFMEG